MIAIIKYNGGNVSSVQNSLNRLNVESVVTDDFDLIRKADKVIFPGVGEASSTMKLLKEKGLDQLIPTLKQPVLGVCLGMQLMCKNNEEGNTVGMGIFDIDVKKFPAKNIVPHMGWNTISDFKSGIFSGIEENSDVYFVHSFIANYRKIQLQFVIIFCRSVLLCKKIIFMRCSFTLKNQEI
jgi:glutamine amidotransferase